MGAGAESAAPHLPPGYPSGSQTRRQGQGRGFAKWLFAILAAVFAVGTVVAAQDPGQASPAVFYAIGGTITLFFVLITLAVWRSGKTGPEHFEVGADPLEVRRGDRVRATLTIRSQQAVTGALEIGLVCTERYDRLESSGETTQRITRIAVAHEEWMPADRMQPEQSVTFDVPADAPFSHEGDCLSYAWGVTARERRNLRVDPHSDFPIWVQP